MKTNALDGVNLFSFRSHYIANFVRLTSYFWPAKSHLQYWTVSIIYSAIWFFDHSHIALFNRRVPQDSRSTDHNEMIRFQLKVTNETVMIAVQSSTGGERSNDEMAGCGRASGSSAEIDSARLRTSVAHLIHVWQSFHSISRSTQS
jgi:hypothetical protein